MLLAALLALIFIRPFISSLAFPYLNIVYTLSLLTILLARLLMKGLNLERLKRLKYPLILYLFAIIISTYFSLNKITSLKELPNYAAALLIFTACLSLPDKKSKLTIEVIILAGTIISALAIYQYFFGFSHTVSYMNRKGIDSQFAADYLARRRVFFPFVTPNSLAGYLAFIIPLVFIIKNKLKWLILPLMLTALFLTKSLGALLSLFLCAGLYLYLKRDFSAKKLALAVILGISLLFVVSLRQSSLKTHQTPSFSFEKRLAYWQDTFSIIKTRPLAGVGPGNFDIPLSRYAHNSYLQVWAETGILGLISFLWLIILAAKGVLRSAKNAGRSLMVIPLATACLTLPIHNFVDFTFFLPEINILWWIVLGFLYSHTYQSQPA